MYLSFIDSIMQRVRLIFFMRSMSRPFILEVLIVSFAVFLSSMYVSFSRIYDNVELKFGSWEIIQYVFSALINTELIVQVLLGASLGISCYFLYEAIRRFKFARRSFGFLEDQTINL